MERLKCKLCPRNFPNGKALGGHMKAHLATLPLPPKPHLTDSNSDSSDEDDEIGNGESPLVYGLRENPRRSFRFADPEFSFVVDAGSVVQDRESETETESRNPTRRRSNRNWSHTNRSEITKKRKSGRLSWPETDSSPPVEPEPVSSVSDTSPEENVAMCLMMLSRDRWLRAKDKAIVEDDSEEEKPKPKSKGKYECEKCKKMFRSHQALGSHRVTHKTASGAGAGASRIFECPFCYKRFGSGQALGGHKRSHMLGSKKMLMRETSIDLNLPAPMEEDSYSVVSDADFNGEVNQKIVFEMTKIALVRPFNYCVEGKIRVACGLKRRKSQLWKNQSVSK